MATEATDARGSAGERGFALVIALLAVALLAALAVAVVTVADVETQVAANFRDGREALYAADAGLARAVAELSIAPRWTDVLTGAAPSAFTDPTLTPEPPGGGARLDLAAATRELQALADAGRRWGANTPVWRLYAWGALAGLDPTGAIDSRCYIVVWVADDPSEVDGDPWSDANGRLLVRADAFGPGATRRGVAATVARDGSSGVGSGGPPAPSGTRILAWRLVR